MENKKKPSLNLENKKGLFFQIGIVIGLAITFMAFNWKQYHTSIAIDGGSVILITEELPAAIIEKPKKPVKQKFTTVFNVVNKLTNDTFELFNPEISLTDTVGQYIPPVYVEPEKNDDDQIILLPEIEPQFPGGVMEMKKYLAKNTVYPEMERNAGITGTVFVGFVIEKDGSVSNTTIERGITQGLDNEAIRVIQAMPRWTPGYQGGRPVRVRYVMPIKFNLN